MPRPPRGFSLLEAIIVLAIATLVLVLAVPVWSGGMEASRAGAAKAALLDSLLRSVKQAALTGSEIVLCPGAAATGCRATSDWSGGWIAFADLDRNRQRGPGEPLLRSADALAGRVHLRSTAGRTRVVIQGSAGNVGSNVTFTLCDGRGAAMATTLVLANDGRLRTGVPTAAQALACMQGAP